MGLMARTVEAVVAATGDGREGFRNRSKSERCDIETRDTFTYITKHSTIQHNTVLHDDSNRI